MDCEVSWHLESALASGLSELMVLRLLREQEMYGYEIVQAIAMRTRQR